MNPQIEAALIAGIVSLISLGGTVVVALRGFRATMQATKMTADESHKDNADTLAVQLEQLDRTLTEQHVRTLNERFAVAAEKLGADKPPAVRLAGIYAMAGLADDWEENRQTCIDVLCGYLRIPYKPDPGDGRKHLDFLGDREVRHTVIRVIAAHLREAAKVSWCGADFDFRGVVFDGGDFTGTRFSDGTVNFISAEFSGGAVYFWNAEFSGGRVDFRGAAFSGGTVEFNRARFSGSTVDFNRAEFSGSTVDFNRAEFSGGTVNFNRAEFSGGTVNFHVTFSGGTVLFSDATFSGSTVDFGSAAFSSGTVNFHGAAFSGGTVLFSGAGFSGSTVHFISAEFSGSTVDFSGAKFSGGTVHFISAEFSGGTVHFHRAAFSGGTVDFRRVGVWRRPPRFDWAANAAPPTGVILPA